MSAQCLKLKLGSLTRNTQLRNFFDNYTHKLVTWPNIQSHSLTICALRNSNLLDWRWWSKLDKTFAHLLGSEFWNFMFTIFSTNKNLRWKHGLSWTFCCYLSDCIRWQFSGEGREQCLNLLWWSEKKKKGHSRSYPWLVKYCNLFAKWLQGIFCGDTSNSNGYFYRNFHFFRYLQQGNYTWV